MPRWRIALAVFGAAFVAVVLYRQFVSRDARIERAYEACMKSFAATPPAPSAAAPAPASDPLGALAQSLGQTMTELVAGVTAGMSGAICGALRDRCKADFDGAICRAGLERFN